MSKDGAESGLFPQANYLSSIRAPIERDSTVGGEPDPGREVLLRVASYQRGVILCILFYLLSFVAQFIVPPPLRLFEGATIVVAVLASAVLVYLLAKEFYGGGLAIALGVLTLIPCIGLFVLVVMNIKAASMLRENGIAVGPLGADLADI